MATEDEPGTRVQVTLALDEALAEQHASSLVDAASEDVVESPLRNAIARAMEVPADELSSIYVVKRSLDARRGRVQFQVSAQVGGRDPYENLGGPHPREVGGNGVTIIVGTGPAGLFAAYELARRGRRCIILDRGKTVQPRRKDLKGLNQRGVVNEDSNYCFGEGGAGTYSDGKLYTRAKKRGPVLDVLGVLALHGAPREILVDARPHIGSNRLPKVLVAMRERLIAAGVEFRFETRVEDFVVEGVGSDRRIRGVVVRSIAQGDDENAVPPKSDVETIAADAVVLATGHSARDMYELCAKHDVALEAKPFALGVRIEHPQPLINKIQYGRDAGHPALPSASYEQRAEADGRGVFSFCMCPGGFIVPAATEKDGIVVNGMSLSRRDSPYANSGLVVAVEVEDILAAGFSGPLAGVEFQRAIEREAATAGGGHLVAPAVRLTDFLRKRTSRDLPATSYQPGIVGADVAAVLDAGGAPLSSRMRHAFAQFESRMKGYVTEEAILVATESRTSAPVRIPRDNQSLQSPTLAGLYPSGEGAGYAGGIVSAALDGIRVGTRVDAELPTR